MGLMDFFSKEAGQKRRAWLTDQEKKAAEGLRYYAGPYAPNLNAVWAMNPVNDIQEAMAAGRDGRWGDMVVNTATAAAPVVAGKVAKAYNPRMADDAAQWLEDALMGVSVNPTTAGAKAAPGNFLADESGNIPLARNPLTPAQQQAQDVLDLLKAGRADEVTDDMLAAADDLYLFENYDLPMDEASRMARADDMGFDTGKPWFHGTPDNRGLIEGGFATQREQMYPELPRKGPYFLSDSRHVASTYADDTRAFDYQGADPETLELFSRPDNPLSVNAHGAHFRGIDIDLVTSAMRRKFGDGPMMDNWLREADRIKAGEDEGWISTDQLSSLTERFGGSDPVDIMNVRDTYTGDGPASTVRMFRDPSSVRRTSARFDPRLKHLANLSAAGAGAAYLGGMTPEEQRKAEIRAYLGGTQ